MLFPTLKKWGPFKTTSLLLAVSIVGEFIFPILILPSDFMIDPSMATMPMLIDVNICVFLLCVHEYKGKYIRQKFTGWQSALTGLTAATIFGPGLFVLWMHLFW